MTAGQGHLLSELRRKVQMVIARGFNDPRIRGLVSVTDVQLSADNAEALVKISVLPAEYGKLAVEGLRSAAGRIQTQLAPTLRIRKVPRFRFELDDSLKRLAALDAAIARSTEAGSPSDSSHPSSDEGPVQ